MVQVFAEAVGIFVADIVAHDMSEVVDEHDSDAEIPYLEII